jgi:transposase
MGAAVSITRLDLTALELRKAASGEKNGAAARRILALALVLDGLDRKTAAETCGMDRQTLRDWVHRYNAAGLAGLRNLKSPGPGSKLTARQQAELAELVEAGPDPAVHGVVRWRRVDLRDELQRRFGELRRDGHGATPRWPVSGAGAETLFCNGNREGSPHISYCLRHAALSAPSPVEGLQVGQSHHARYSPTGTKVLADWPRMPGLDLRDLT